MARRRRPQNEAKPKPVPGTVGPAARHLDTSAVLPRQHGGFLISPPNALPETRIRAATPADRKFVDALQRRHSAALGFLPREALEWYLAHNSVVLADERAQEAGYILGRTHLAWQPLLRPITQAAVCMDAMRRHHGLHLLESVTAAATAAGQVGLQAICAVGLEANEFWKAAGFYPICHLTPQNVRARELICWRKPLTAKVPTWFASPPPRAGTRARTTNCTRNPNRKEQEIERAAAYISSAIRGRNREEV